MAPAITLAILALLFAGCLYIPTSSSAPPLEGNEVRPADTEFLKPGETTKDEVIARLGTPTMFWRDENVLIYRWVKQKGIVLWAVAVGYGASFGSADVSEELAFLLKFDESDRFVSSDVLTKPAFKSYGDFLIDWRDAQRSRDRSSKQDPP